MDNESLGFQTINTEISAHSPPLKLCKYIKNISIMTFPTMLFFLCLFLQQTINLIFIGQSSHLANKENIIEGIGITHLYINTTLLSISVGLASGFETLGSHAFGSKNYRLFGLYYHRSIIISLTFTCVMIVIHYFTALKVLAFFTIKPEIIVYVSEYMTTYLFFVIPDVFFSANFRYINIISKSHVNLITLAGTICLHPLWCYIFIIVLDFGLKGAAIAIIISQSLNALSGFFYICVIKPCPASVFFINRDSFKSFWSYLKITLPGTFMLCAEWWAFEVQAIIAIWASDADYAAHILVSNINGNFYTISLGFGITTVVYVGKLISHSTVTKTKKYAKTIFIYGLVFMSAFLIIVFILRDKIIYMYMKENESPEVVEKATGVMLLLVGLNVVDYIQTVLGYVLRGLGKQLIASVVAFVNFYLIQTSMSVLLGIYFKLGVLGIWLGITIGSGLGAILYAIVLLRLDLKEIQKEVLERLESDKNDLKEQEILLVGNNQIAPAD
jgi:MATE family multidrug resistance protein